MNIVMVFGHNRKTNMSDKLTINIDATALGTSACLRHFYGTTVGSVKDNVSEGGFKTTMSAAAIYGIAIHKFIDTMYRTGGDGIEATKQMRKAFNVEKNPPGRTQQYLVEDKHLFTSAWNLWNDKIENDTNFEVLQVQSLCYWCDGKGCDKCKDGVVQGPATEITFKIKFYEDEFVIIYLCGTIDTLGKFTNGCFAIRDWKTTSSYKQDTFISNFELSRQLRIYSLAAKLVSRSNPESTLGKIGSTKIGAFIDAIFIKPNANDNEYVRSDVFQFSDDDITIFESMLLDFCKEFSMQCAAAKNMFEVRPQGILNGTCIQTYGHCKFWNVCKNNRTVGELILNREFKRKVYDPLTFNE